MNRIVLCIAVLLLASGACGQAKQKLSTYHVEIIWQGKPLCCVTVQEPPRDGFETAFAVIEATHATVWTDAEWKSCDPCVHPEKYGLEPDVPAKQEKKASPDDLIRACEYENAGLPCLIGRLPTTFDVPPKEWDGPDTIGSQIGEETHGDGICMDTMGDIKCDEKIHHRTCTDKKRVLLMSEDGKWHCYDFDRLEHR